MRSACPGGVMLTYQDPDLDAVAEAVLAIAVALETALEPAVQICPHDGCLLLSGTGCPACEVRTRPAECACGRRMQRQRTECWRCARQAPQRVCGCGIHIRTEADQCSRCRKKSTASEDDESICPVGWVRQGLIWWPVYQESEVA